jgi:hypothetical protein
VSDSVNSPATGNPADGVSPAVRVLGDPQGLDACFTQPANTPQVRFSEELLEAILDLYLTGMPLYKIASEPGMPATTTLWRWLRDHPSFRDRVTATRKIRAMQHEEQALAVADPHLSKDEVPAARLAHDAHRWAAEVNDPETYGKRNIIQGDASKPIVFKVVSHIPESVQDELEKPPLTVKEVIRPDIEVTPTPAEVGYPTDDPEPPGAA